MPSSNSLAQAVEDFNQSFNRTFERITADEDNLMAIREQFVENVKKIPPVSARPKTDNPLVEIARELEAALDATIAASATAWDARKASRDLAAHYSDKIIFLVFGKVNAGKSSFCNYIASTFPPELVRFFYLESGKVVDTDQGFAEGVTETTSRIQGVELGKKLILLDSPGLHSVTDENGERTRLFTDSSDAMLWLTASTSPGQVQELEDLAREIKKDKPLLPVITRSDVYEEELDGDGEIVRVLVNKPRANRRMQEANVLERAQAQLRAPAEIRQPLSVSVHAYWDSSHSDEDLDASGLGELESRMVALVRKAAAYKPRKARQHVINYLEDSVLKPLRKTILPCVSEAKAGIELERKSLKKKRQEVLSKLQEELAERVNEWAEDLKESQDRSKLANQINELVTDRLHHQLRKSVEGFAVEVNSIIVEIGEEDIGEYRDLEIEYQRVSGRTQQAVASSGSAVGGAALGMAVAGPAGAVVGGLLGGLLGGAGGKLVVKTDIVKQKVGVDATQAVRETLERLDEKLPAIVDEAFRPWEEILIDMARHTGQVELEIGRFEKKLDSAKQGVRDECH